MAATVDANPGDHPLPARGSLYYDYLVDMPAGLTMDFELSPDAEALEDEEKQAYSFTAKKIAGNKWLGVPNTIGAVSSQVLFEHVLAQQQKDKDTIIVSLGGDPLKVKKERAERGEEEEEEKSEAPIIMSIHDAILLDSDCEDESLPLERLKERPGRSVYEKVCRCTGSMRPPSLAHCTTYCPPPWFCRLFCRFVDLTSSLRCLTRRVGRKPRRLLRSQRRQCRCSRCRAPVTSRLRCRSRRTDHGIPSLQLHANSWSKSA